MRAANFVRNVRSRVVALPFEIAQRCVIDQAACDKAGLLDALRIRQHAMRATMWSLDHLKTNPMG